MKDLIRRLDEDIKERGKLLADMAKELEDNRKRLLGIGQPLPGLVRTVAPLFGRR